MSETQKAARFNITLPPDLRGRMEAAPSVNWSAVAAEAFKRRLLEIESHTKEGETMQDLVKRLKAADELDSNQATQRGREAGEAWVRQLARPKHLRALAMLDTCEAQYNAEGWIEVYNNGMNEGSAIGVWQAMHPTATPISDRRHRREQAEAFWAQVFDKGGVELMNDPCFARGFVRGALDLWEKVSDKV